MKRVLSIAAAAVAWSAGAGELRAKSFAEILSPNALFFLEVPDYARAREAYLRLPRARLWWEGAGRRFLEKWIESLDDKHVSRAIGAFAKAVECPSGRLVYAIEPPRHGELDMPAFVFLAEAGGRADELKELVVRIIGEEMVEKEEVEVEGMRFSDLGGILVGSAGGTVMAAYDESAAREVLLRFGERPWRNLEACRAFRLLRERLGERADYLVFLNFGEVWRFLAPDMAQEDWRLVESSGLSQLVATALAGRFTPGGVVERWGFLLRGRARGMWKLLRPAPLSRRTWAGLPESTSGFLSLNIDLAARARPFLELLRKMDEDLHEEFVEPFEEFREATGVSFERDILPLAAGELTLAFLDEPKEAGEPVPGRRAFLAVELADAARARRVMEGLARRGDDEDVVARRRRFADLDGWQVELDGDVSFFIAGEGDIAYISLVAEPIERIARALSRNAGRLTETARFREAAAWIPRETAFAAYSDVRELVRGLYRLAESDCRREGVAGLPALDDLMAGLSPLTAALEIEKPGFTFEIRSPHGFWPFYGQLVASLVWEIDVEPRLARKDAARLVHEKAMRRLNGLRTPEEKVRFLLKLRAELVGTRYAASVGRELARQTALLREERRRRGEEVAVAGRVLGVNQDVNLVLLSVGKDDDVRAGMEFTVYRKGERIATVEVEKVLPRISSARIVRRFGEALIRIGDEVRSKKPEPAEPPAIF